LALLNGADALHDASNALLQSDRVPGTKSPNMLPPSANPFGQPSALNVSILDAAKRAMNDAQVYTRGGKESDAAAETLPEKDEPKTLGPNGAAVVTAVALAADPIGSAEEADKL
jgi:hypothetical protein